MRPRRPAALLLLAVALLTASCSSQSDEPAAVAPAPAAESPAPSEPPPPSPVASAASTPSASPSPSPSASPAPSAPPSPSPAGAMVTITGFEYVVPASVRPGAQVTVVNQDRETHTVTIDGGAVRMSVLPGATAVFTAPTAPGRHSLTCDLHGGMDAVLVVD